MVRCGGLLATSFKEANSSLESGSLRREADNKWRFNFATCCVPPNQVSRWMAHDKFMNLHI
jgi:hypothetical protein